MNRWGADPPGGPRSPLEDTHALRARMGSAGGLDTRAQDVATHKLYQELVDVKNENTMLRAQNEELQGYKRQSMDLTQKLLKAQADNSTLHESLRDAQELLEEAMVDTPALEAKLDEMKSRVQIDTRETRRLYESLKAAQKRATALEEDMQKLHMLAGTAGERGVEGLAAWITTSKRGLLEAARTPEPKAAATGAAPPTVKHPVGGVGVGGAYGKVTPARVQNVRATNDPQQMQALLEDLLQELANLRETSLDAGMRHADSDVAKLATPPADLAYEGPEADKELIGVAWDALLPTDEKLGRYRARLRQALAELANAREEVGRLHKTLDASNRPHAEAIVRELAEYKTEVARLRDEKQRLLNAVKLASTHRKAQEELLNRRYPDEASSEMSFSEDGERASPAPARATVDAEVHDALKEERDSLMDQLVAARAAAQAAELLKQDSQDERGVLLTRLETAQNQIVGLQNKLDLLQVQPPKIERGVSPVPSAVLDPLDATSVGDLSGVDIVPAFTVTAEDKKEVVDEFALESLRHVLQQTQQLLERSDQQLLEERDRVKALDDQLEELRCALETTLKEAAELQHERDALATERDQWAQAARDADDARRKLVEHIELYQASNASQREGGKVQAPELTELLREKAELLVQIDILKERLADSMEELEGARRELVNSLDARGELQRQQDTNAEVLNALRETEAEKDKIEQEKAQLETETQHLMYQLENAKLVKNCSSEKLEKMKRENEEMQRANATLKKELEDQMKEIAFLCDTLTETSAQYEESTRKLEQTDSERHSLLADKHKDLQRIEELSGKLTQVRLQNDREAIEERKQLQQERELDAMILAERMKELQECKDEIAEVKARASKAINILKVSLQNSLLQMKTLGDEFEMEKAARAKQAEQQQQQCKRLEEENEQLRKELSQMTSKEGTDRLKEKVALLSDGLKETRERFAEQTQAYEKAKSQLKAVSKQLSNNASYKPLFDEANETIEALMNKNQQYQRENAKLREEKNQAVEKATQNLEDSHDEEVKALRSQILALQAEVKREKSLRVRQKEQQDRSAEEQEAYERDMTALVEEITKELEDRTEQLEAAETEKTRLASELKEVEANLAVAQRSAGQRNKGKKAEPDRTPVALQKEVADMEKHVISLRAENKALTQDVESLTQELHASRDKTEAKVKAATHHADSVVYEYNTMLRYAKRIHLLASVHCGENAPPLLIPEEPMELAEATAAEGEVAPDGETRTFPSVPSAAPIADQLVTTVRTALEKLKATLEERAAAATEGVGFKQAEVDAMAAELSARLKTAEDEKAALTAEVRTATGELKRHREDNQHLKEEVLRLESLAQNGEAMTLTVATLKKELTQALDAKDRVLEEMHKAKRDKADEVVSLMEATNSSGAKYEILQNNYTNLEAEFDVVRKEKDALERVAAQLRKTVEEVQGVATASEKKARQAQMKCDEAVKGREADGKEKVELQKKLEAIRKELLDTKADFARLQAVCQDLDSLNQMIDDTQDELLRTKQDLDTTREELQRAHLMRDHDVEARVAEERERIREEVVAVQAEKDMLHSQIDTIQREAERSGLASGREAADAKERLRMMEDDRVRLDERVLTAEGAIARKDEELARKEEHINALERQVLDLENAAGQASPRRTEEFERVRQEIAANNDAMRELQETLDAREAELAQLLMKNAALVAEVQSKDAFKHAELFGTELQVSTPLDRFESDRARHIEEQLAALRAENERIRADRDNVKRELEEGREIMLALVGPLDGRMPPAAQ